jgi:glycerol-3-phosphate acyltransferase PlsY
MSAVFAPLFDIFLFGPNVVAWAVFAMSALLVWRHRANIAKLIAGKESRIGEKKAAAAAPAHHARKD